MNPHACRFLLRITLPLWFGFGGVAVGQEWTRFRGPGGAGLSDAATIPATWTTSDYK